MRVENISRTEIIFHRKYLVPKLSRTYNISRRNGLSRNYPLPKWSHAETFLAPIISRVEIRSRRNNLSPKIFCPEII